MELKGFCCGSERCVELRVFLSGTEGFLVLNREVLGVELIGFWFGTEGFWGLKRSGLFVWNSCVDLKGGGVEPGEPFFYIFFVGNALPRSYEK